MNLTRIVQTVARALAPLKTETGKDIHIQSGTDSASRPALVHGEELLCYSMLFHLIKNALEASPPGLAVTVTLDHTPQQDRDQDTDQDRDWHQEARPRTRVRIANSGVVPPEIRGRFMEKGATWGKPDSKGLGAYSARLIAETLGATHHVHIDDENQRTEIVLEFPV